MLKYAVAFVLSTGVLVYFIAPVSEEVQPEPAVETKAPTPQPPKKVEAEYWGDDAVDENFTFGEPVKYNDGEYQNNIQETAVKSELKESAVDPAPSSFTTNTVESNSTISQPKIIKTPKPGEPGSRENPINMSPSKAREQPQ